MKKYLSLFIIISLIHTQILAAGFGVKSTTVENPDQLERDLNRLLEAANIVQVSQDRQADAAHIITKVKNFVTLNGKWKGATLLDPITDFIEGLAKGKNEKSERKFQLQVNAHIHYVVQKDEERFKSIINIKDDTTRAQELFKALDDLDSFSSLAPPNTKARAIVNSRAIASIIKVLKVYGGEIEKLKSKLKSDSKEYKGKKDIIDEYNSKSSRAIASYFEATEELGEATEKVLTKAEGNLKSLQKNQAQDSNVTPPERQSYIEDFAIVVEKSQKVVDSASALLTIADNFGLINEEKYAKVAKAINQAQTTITGVSQIAIGVSSSNPVAVLQGIATLSGLFGKPKPDAGAERHKQVMSGLQNIQKSISGLYRGQEQLYQLQIRSIELMGTYHKLTAEKLDTNFEILHDSVAGLQDITRQLSQLSSGLKACSTFLNSRFSCDARKLSGEKQLKECVKKNNKKNTGFTAQPYSRYSKLLSGDFTNYQARTKHYNKRANVKSYAQCEGTLAELFGTSTDEFSPLFYARAYSSNDDKTFRALNYGIYRPLWDIAKKHFLNGNQNHLLASLSSPTSRLSAIPTKYSKLLRAYKRNPKDYISIEQEALSNRMRELLDVSAIERYVYTLLEVVPYFDITEESFIESTSGYFTGAVSPQQLYSRDEISSEEMTMKDDTLYALDTALSVINTSIAQQSLMAGDLILPYIYQNLFSRKQLNIFSEDEREARAKLLSLYSRNRILTKNLLNYEMQRNLRYKRMLKIGGSGFGGSGYSSGPQVITSADNQINRHLSFDENFKFNFNAYESISSNMYSRDRKKSFKAFEALTFITATLPDSIVPYKFGDEAPPVGGMSIMDKKTILDDLNLKFPKPGEIAEDKVHYSYEMYRLLHLRQKVVEMILSFEDGADQIINQTLTIY
ncbi:MAG: hypothetical protein KAG61_08650 [Bacteriovoracaceae bacterium]|nr:hypothetical protein [Bacteriovoracaceae bacterium]